jgi:hypothetical protein
MKLGGSEVRAVVGGVLLMLATTASAVGPDQTSHPATARADPS